MSDKGDGKETMSLGKREERHRKGSRSKKTLGKKLAYLFIGAIVLLGLSLVWKIYLDVDRTSKSIYHPVVIDKKRKDQVDLSQGKKPFSLLLMGIDTGELGRTEKGRSDTLIVATVNPKTKTTKLLSIPRDTYTYIRSVAKKDKINHAYAFGGPSESINTVQRLLDIPIDYYVAVNMKGLEGIIDIVGGIEVTPSISFTQEGHSFTAGQPVKLNGEKALAYVRNRYDDPQGDYGRQARQREIILACTKKLASLSNLANYREILNTLGSNVQTNLQFSQMRDLYANYRHSLKKVEDSSLRGAGQMIDGVYYEIIPDEVIKEASQNLKAQLK